MLSFRFANTDERWPYCVCMQRMKLNWYPIKCNKIHLESRQIKVATKKCIIFPRVIWFRLLCDSEFIGRGHDSSRLRALHTDLTRERFIQKFHSKKYFYELLYRHIYIQTTTNYRKRCKKHCFIFYKGKSVYSPYLYTLLLSLWACQDVIPLNFADTSHLISFVLQLCGDALWRLLLE